MTQQVTITAENVDYYFNEILTEVSDRLSHKGWGFESIMEVADAEFKMKYGVDFNDF